MGGMGGLLGTPSVGADLARAIGADADRFTWAAATVGSNNASGYQLATRAPVMAVGGFNGTDPAPTLAQFQRYVSDHRIHYFVVSDVMGRFRSNSGGSAEASAITEWVTTTFQPVTYDGVTLYDVSRSIA